jgi:hypothetical protein
MSTSHCSLPAHWQFYSDRAYQAHHGRVDDFGYGCEELLWETLAVIQSGVRFTEDCRQRLDRIPWNRAKKHRRMRKLLAQGLPRERASETDIVETADLVDMVRCVLSPSEFEVEHCLASGQSYAKLAIGRGCSPDALKVRVGRWRARIRRLLGRDCGGSTR